MAGSSTPDNLPQNVIVQVIDIDDVLPDPENANAGTPRGAAVMDYSVDQFGAGRGIAVDAKNRALAGNKTVGAARHAGIKKVVVVETDGDVLVATRRRDMDLDDPTSHKAREYTIADNRAAELGLNYDADRIAAAVEAGADLSVLFYDDELAQLTGEAMEYWEEDEGYGEDLGDPVPEMEIQPFEHYDYMLVIFRTSLDWSRALDLMASLGLVKKGFTVSAKTRKVGLCRVLEGSKLLDLLAQAQGGVASYE